MILYERPLRIEVLDNMLLINGEEHARAVRTAEDMEKTLVDANIAENFDVYYMFRNIYASDDIRFDITIILANALGSEFPKTFGHYHPKSDGGVPYPEVYQILKGQALFILQKNNPDKSVDVIMIDGKEGDVVLVPPYYGHVSINNGEDTLIMANLVYEKFNSIYDEYRDNQGAAYHILKDGEIKQNTNYVIDKNERINAKELNERYKFTSKDLLSEFHENPQKFLFLQKPEMLFK